MGATVSLLAFRQRASTLPRATGGASGPSSPAVCLRTAWRSDEPRMGRGFARVRSFFSTSGDAAVGEVALSNAADDPKAALRPMVSCSSHRYIPTHRSRSRHQPTTTAAMSKSDLFEIGWPGPVQVPTLPAAGAQADSTHTCCSKQLRPNHKEEQAAKIIRLRHQLQTSGKANTAGAQLVEGGELQQACDVVSDAYLYRWLRARSWDVALAATDIVKHAQWRVAFMPNGGISQEAVAKELATEKLILQGFDCHGRPLVIILVKMAVAHAERNPRGQCTVLLDLTDMAMVSMDVQAIRTLFNLLGDHYVER
ncbi:CRAL-TRIO domain-containing protein [Haematococcus lacustris]|uniref:CRAL-TRIO domain-containing protein n=1 Tax=Haematococcus lacustris TaxID=44745 RepID=A0A699ZSP3_HAELA|nr:CRAL-TRIO domain-containing protein [Haematococcus lacustris]